MTKEDVKKKITKYSMQKYVICFFLISLIIVMLISIAAMQIWKFKWISYCAIGSYVSLIVCVIIACVFPLNKPLTEFVSEDDYKAILEYFIDMSDGMGELAYHDGLFLIKRAFTKTIRNISINELKEIPRKHLCYMEGIVFRNTENNSLIPKKLLNRTYMKHVCSLLLAQINENRFYEDEINRIPFEKSESKKHTYISSKAIYIIITVILVVLVIGKLIFSINETLYGLTSTNIFARVVYNTSADVVAICFAIHTLIFDK